MWIMTVNGWMPLCPKGYQEAAEPVPYNGVPAPYAGAFPSKSLCQFVNGMKEEMKYFDDGLRMFYLRFGERRVEVENAQAIHPIKYPPVGF